MLKTKKRSPEAGFTLVEVMAAVGILAAVMVGFSTLLGSVGASQKIIERERVATRALSNEVEKIQATRWDDLMPRPETYESCALDDIRTAYPAVVAGPEVMAVDRVNLTITREVKWHMSDTPVECAEGARDKAEPKSVLITVTWDNGQGKTMSTQTKVVRSRWSEGPTNLEIGTRTVLKETLSLADASGWCSEYTEGTTSFNPGTAKSSNEKIGVLFSKSGGICGTTVSGLTAGKTYTAVVKLSVPEGSKPVELAVKGGFRGGVVPADGKRYTLAITWTQVSGTSALVGPQIQTGVTNDGFSEAIVESVRIYEH